MSSVLFITIQYDLTKFLARELEKQANGIYKVSSQQIEASKNDITLAWKGENAVKYTQKLNTLETKISNNAKGLERSAQTIQTMAENIYRAELRAIEIARQRY